MKHDKAVFLQTPTMPTLVFPQLSDQAAYTVCENLRSLLELFGNHYFLQIRRYDQEPVNPSLTEEQRH